MDTFVINLTLNQLTRQIAFLHQIKHYSYEQSSLSDKHTGKKKYHNCSVQLPSHTKEGLSCFLLILDVQIIGIQN